MPGEPRLSFGREVEAYERARPPYAEDAVAWIAERLPFGRVLDLGAGTGKLTRQLLRVAREVVAVEPDDDMREMLERVVPGVESRRGSAEAIPLPDESVDAVTVAQAFHWFEAEAALAEMRRVLRPGGGIALLWNVYAWPPLEPILAPLIPVRDDDDERDRLWATPHFTNFEQRDFAHSDRVDADAVVERITSISAVIVAPADVRARVLGEVRALVGPGMIEFPMRTTVVVADRV